MPADPDPSRHPPVPAKPVANPEALPRLAPPAGAASHRLAEGAFEAPLGSLPPRVPASLPPQAPVGDALRLMQSRRIGSVLVVDDDGAARGILTRHDVLDRIALPGLPLDTPLEAVMSAPLHSLTVLDSAHDAALLMARRGLRHVPLTDQGRVVSIVSERDLFALQRLSLGQIGAAIREAGQVSALPGLAADVRAFAHSLLAQGLGARALTALVSHLNDLLCARAVGLTAAEDGIDLAHVGWLAFGSEGRAEQTIATDQDNGLVFEAEDPERKRSRWLAWAGRVNTLLDACGYPLCRGRVMASNPACCLSVGEWLARFDHWIDHGAPDDLLQASIYFDLRPIVGDEALAQRLRAHVTARAGAVPRFLKQLADNALRHRPPLTWLGAVDTEAVDGHAVVDLKRHGTALFVDAARVLALAHGVAATGTRARLVEAAQRMRVPAAEGEAWAAAFEFLQMLRLQVQSGPAAGDAGDAANQVEPSRLNLVDRRMLKESLRVARQLQQRLALDFQR